MVMTGNPMQLSEDYLAAMWVTWLQSGIHIMVAFLPANLASPLASHFPCLF